ncbi:hypothetical protein ABPG77_009807 [Micractinium sp. CCAP 211/92]
MREEGIQGQEGYRAEGAARDAAESLPCPLEHILSEVFRCYQARSPEELMALLKRRYREDAMFVDPTLAARPRWEVALTFYSLQRVYSSVHVSGISQPLVQLARPAGKAGQPELLEVFVHSRQEFEFARTKYISQQVLPESQCMETTTRLLLDPRTGQVVRHEDSWENKPAAIVLPMAWRRLNAFCQNGVYRLLGWGRVLQAAEAHAARGSWDEG